MNIAVTQDQQPNLNLGVGRAVAAALKARGATGREIGVVLGLSKAQVSARLNGHTPFRADELVTIGRHLDVDPGQFLSDAPAFPLRREWTLLTGTADTAPIQPTLPFRAPLRVV